MPAPHFLALLASRRRLQVVLFTSFLGRLPLGVVTVLLLFALSRDGSLGLAGLVSGAAVAGLATGGPAQGRLLDRLPTRPVLGCSALLQAAALLALTLALGSAPGWLLVCLSFFQGVTVPALPVCVRLALRRAVGAEDPGPAYAFDAVVMEVVYLAGPALAAWGTAVLDPRLLLAGCAVLVVAGTAGFLAAAPASWTTPVTPSSPAPRQGDELSAPAGHRIAPVICFVAAMALLAAPFGLSEVALTRLAADLGTGLAPVGTTLTLMGLGSVVGGLLYGTVRRRLCREHRFRLLALTLGCGIGAAALAPGFAAVHALFALAGLAVAPLAGLCFEILDRLSPPGQWMRVQSWGSVAHASGHAGGLALAGALASYIGADGLLLLAGLSVAVATLVAAPALVSSRRTGRPVADGAPAPDGPPPGASDAPPAPGRQPPTTGEGERHGQRPRQSTRW